MEKLEFHPLSDVFPLMLHDELIILAEDIKKNGLQFPIVLFENKILDGRNRYNACNLCEIEPFYNKYVGKNPLQFVLSTNLHRRHLNESQRAVIAAKLANMKSGTRTDLEPCLNLSKVISQSQAAELLNVSRSILQSAKIIEKEAPELIQKIEKGEMSIHQADMTIKRKKKLNENLKIAEKKIELPDKKYDVIVIDPPWPMQKIERECRENQVKELDFPVMTEDELKKLKIPASDNCHFWLWTTHKFLPLSFELLIFWGFKYVCCFVWHKNGGFQPYDLPQYNCEFVLYAKKGNPQFVDLKNFKVCFNAERGKHSEKPIEFYEMVKRVTSENRIDMFARKKIDGFDSWGNEV